MWAVVNFVEENTVECVPHFWYKNNLCAWPNKNLKNSKKAVEHRYKPNSVEFDFFKARLISNNIAGIYNKQFCN
jgi:hypothetical protein